MAGETRRARRRAARLLAEQFGVPFALAAKAVQHVTEGRATAAFSASIDLRSVPVEFERLDDLVQRLTSR